MFSSENVGPFLCDSASSKLEGAIGAKEQRNLMSLTQPRFCEKAPVCRSTSQLCHEAVRPVRARRESLPTHKLSLLFSMDCRSLQN